MPKSKKSKSKKIHWYQELNESDVDSAFEEATVDAYDPSEQLQGLFNALEDELVFPFLVSALGEELTATNIEMADNDNCGLDLVVQRGAKSFCIEVRSVQLLEPLPDGHLVLAAYLHWKKSL